MKRSQAVVCAGIAVGAALLYLAPLGSRGLVGPDEPRYAAVAREMAEGGDWITPVLWGEPWFEKPILVYWLGATAYTAGVEEFTRVPAALLGLGFLVFFYRVVGRHFGRAEAQIASLILATSAGWTAFSDVGGFDMPLAVFAGAALLSLLPWVENQEEKRAALPAFGALLGLAVLAKGLVAPVIAFLALLPLLWETPRRALALIGPRALLPFALVALPWYGACLARNGRTFWQKFIVEHHVERFFTASLEHVQPVWFYLPVTALFLLPWTPLAAALRLSEIAADRRLRFLAAWAVGLLLLFSISVNKLPGYVLPALPPLAILSAVAWVRRPSRAAALVAAASLLLIPPAVLLLPRALADGFGKAWASVAFSDLPAAGAAGAAAVALAAFAGARRAGRRAPAVVAAAATLLLALLKFETYPAVSRLAGARELYFEHRARAPQLCIGDVRRHTEYGLRYYSRDGIPLCSSLSAERQARGAVRFAVAGDPPRLVPLAGKAPTTTLP